MAEMDYVHLFIFAFILLALFLSLSMERYQDRSLNGDLLLKSFEYVNFIMILVLFNLISLLTFANNFI